MKSGLFWVFCLQVLLSIQPIDVFSQKKPTICVLGGTPSTSDILTLIPDSIKNNYNFISFNRPGFGGSKNEKMSEALLYQLAKDAGLKKNDFAVIGISGGGPFALLLASKFKLKHCGIISGMVSKDAYFKYADKAITKNLMETALKSFEAFDTAVRKFPNTEAIVKQGGAASAEIVIQASYDEFNFIFSEGLYSNIPDKSFRIDWWHGEQDVNIPLPSVELFLKNYPNAHLNKIPNATHNINSNIYISRLLKNWE